MTSGLVGGAAVPAKVVLESHVYIKGVGKRTLKLHEQLRALQEKPGESGKQWKTRGTLQNVCEGVLRVAIPLRAANHQQEPLPDVTVL